jgi:hypothetical protein
VRARFLLALTTAGLLASGCGSNAAPSRSGPAPSGGPAPCGTGFTPPEGFHPTERFTERYSDHLGVRQGYRDDLGRELHVFAGIPGEFGEGLPPAGTVAVTTGQTAVLLGRNEVWVLSWDAEGPCAARAVLGHGFGRRGFLGTLQEAGVVQGP